MHIFRGSFSYISEFEIIFINVYDALIVLSSITKKGKIESVSRPPSWFWCLNDKTIKELMSFTKCEIGKMSCNYIELFKTYVMANFNSHFDCHMTIKISLREKGEQRINHLYFMSIFVLEYIQDMNTYSSTSG
jgi:hypothetical protein